jgi:beta-lactamase regulating signal transducer with metallopeptidase domain
VSALFHIGVSNALAATVLAALALAAGKLARRPALGHALWLLVLLKLVTPPLVVVPIDWPAEAEAPPSPAVAAAAAPQEAAHPVVVNNAEPELVARRLRAPVAVAERRRPAPSAELTPEGLHAVLPPVREPDRVPAETAAPAGPAVTTPPAPGFAWIPLLTACWLTGSTVWFAVALARIGRFQRLLRHARPADDALQAEASRIAARLGLRDCPGVWLVPGTLSPLLWAVVGVPRLLLPVALLGRLDEAGRATLLAHELAHYRRRDHWVRCLEFVTLGLYWWFPVLWWARRELREAEEQCCDAWVVWALPGAAKAYARALVETLDFLSASQPALPPAASGLGPLPVLRRRLTMIMRGPAPRALTGLGVLAVLGLAALLLPLVPTWAQVAGDSDPAAAQAKDKGKDKDKDLDKARDELKRATDELAKVKADYDKVRAEYDAKAAKLQQAMDKMKTLEGTPGAKKGPWGEGPGKGRPGAATESMEKRLADVEKKLDTVIQELQELRKQMGGKGGKGPGGGGPRFGPGGGFGGPGFGPGGGGFGPGGGGAGNPPPGLRAEE